jgi:hypothetical protein
LNFGCVELDFLRGCVYDDPVVARHLFIFVEVHVAFVAGLLACDQELRGGHLADLSQNIFFRGNVFAQVFGADAEDLDAAAFARTEAISHGLDALLALSTVPLFVGAIPKVDDERSGLLTQALSNAEQLLVLAYEAHTLVLSVEHMNLVVEELEHTHLLREPLAGL